MTAESKQLDTPVLFLIFNRPDATKLVFKKIQQVRPKKLFVAADGPRESVESDKERCAGARKIVELIDWPCELHTLFQERNNGAGLGSAKAIDWFFGHVEEGIVLEDDDIPDLSFFRFCSDLLARYRDDDKVMMVSGDNFLFDRKKIHESYYFSIYPMQWGWATWRRAWKKYDYKISTLPDFIAKDTISSVLQKPIQKKYWMDIFQKMYGGTRKDAWDYQWAYAMWRNGGLCAAPSKNLVSNIGYSKDATHTTDTRSRLANVPALEMAFPLDHPTVKEPDRKADDLLFYTYYGRNLTLERRSKDQIRKMLRRYLKINI